MRVIVGGTFAYLHKGHKALLRKAFSIGDYVYIGLTSDRYVAKTKGVRIESYTRRKAVLKAFADTFKKRFMIKKLDDRYGPSAIGNFDAIVLSRETERIGEQINRLREKRGLSKLRIYVIPYIKAYNGKPISSKRIYVHEIDREGRRRL